MPGVGGHPKWEVRASHEAVRMEPLPSCVTKNPSVPTCLAVMSQILSSTSSEVDKQMNVQHTGYMVKRAEPETRRASSRAPSEPQHAPPGKRDRAASAYEALCHNPAEGQQQARSCGHKVAAFHRLECLCRKQHNSSQGTRSTIRNHKLTSPMILSGLPKAEACRRPCPMLSTAPSTSAANTFSPPA